jgi:siroheme synthase
MAKSGSAVNFERLANPDITLVVLMGVAQRASIAAQLRRGGLDAATPVAVIECASMDEQRVVRGRLDELADFDVASPAVIVVGRVAAIELGLADVVEDLVATS